MVSGSIKKLFSVVSIFIFSLNWLCQYLSFLSIFLIDLARWKSVGLHHIAYILIKLLIFFISTLEDIYFLEFISHYIKKYCMKVLTPKETNHKWKQRDIHFYFYLMSKPKNPVIFNAEWKFFINNFQFFLVSWTHFLKVIKSVKLWTSTDF